MSELSYDVGEDEIVFLEYGTVNIAYGNR